MDGTANQALELNATGVLPSLARGDLDRRGAPDRFARRVLRIQERASGEDVHNVFSSSILLSATRCLLSYIVFPVLAPWVGALPLIGPAIGLPVGAVALVLSLIHI